MITQPFARRHGNIQWTPDLEEMFMKLWNSDMDIKMIAAILDITPKAVSVRATFLRRKGYHLPTRSHTQSAWVSKTTWAKLDAMLVYICGRYDTSAEAAKGKKRTQDGRLDARRAITVAARMLHLSWKQIAIYFNRTRHTVPIFWSKRATDGNREVANAAVALIRNKERAE